MEQKLPITVKTIPHVTRWIITARWFYVLLAFFFGISVIAEQNFARDMGVLLLALIFLLLANAFFYWFLRVRSIDAGYFRKRDWGNVLLLLLDLVYFFLLILLAGKGTLSIVHVFLVIPVIVGVVSFGSAVSLMIALFSGVLVFLSVCIHEGILAALVGSGNMPLFDKTLSLLLLQSGILLLTYVCVAVFVGAIVRLLNERNLLFLEQIKKEEGHVNRLQELTGEFDKSAKLLVRRDLELSNANQKLIQLDQMKSEIISVVAHQLRTPLSAIKWSLKILLDEEAGKITPEQRELLTKGFESNERMIGLINDTLEVDHLESGKIKYNFIPVQFEDLVQDMIRNLLPLATQKNVRVEFRQPGTQLPKIKIDPDKMRDVLQNLIDNAIKYTRANGTITVGVAQEGGDFHFLVKDNGIGIPETEKDKIFSRFFRAANAVRTATDGSGLGLFIAQSVVKRHGGKVWFESVLNEGTTFHVLLPFSS